MLGPTTTSVTLWPCGESDEAIVQYKMALEIQPNCVEAHNNLGLALGKRGQLDEAIAQFQRALALQPDYVNRAETVSLPCLSGEKY